MNVKSSILTFVALSALLLYSDLCGAQSKLDALKDSGYFQLRQYRYKDAIETYTQCLKLKQDPEFYHSRALAYQGLSKIDSALADLNTALKTDSNHYKSILSKTKILQAKKSWKESYDLIDKALRLKPSETEPYLTKAQLQMALHDTLGALISLDQYIKFNTSNPDAYHLRGLISMSMNQPADAAFNFNRALFLNPKYMPSLLQRAQLFFKRDYLAITFADLETAIKIDSNLSQIHELYVKVYFKLGEYELVKKHIRLVSKNNLEIFELQMIMAEIALIDGQPEQCIKLVNEFVGKYPLSNQAFLLRAKAYYANRNYSYCFNECNRILLSGDSTLKEVFKFRALSRPKEKDHSEWKKNLSDISIYLKYNPLDSEAWLIKARTRFLLNEIGFCEDYQKAKTLGLKTPDNELETVCK